MRFVGDQRVVGETRILARVGHDQRLGAEHGMRAEAGGARGFARVDPGTRKEQLAAFLDHGHHRHRHVAQLGYEVDQLLQFGIVDHSLRTVRSQHREALVLVAIGIRRRCALGPKYARFAKHGRSLPTRSKRLSGKAIPRWITSGRPIAFAPSGALGYRPAQLKRIFASPKERACARPPISISSLAKARK